MTTRILHRVLGTLAVSCILLAALPASAQTERWVSQTTGDDANDGASAESPYATLQKAIDNSTNGVAGSPSIIYVDAGTYRGVDTNPAACGYPAAIVVKDFSYLTIMAIPGAEPVVQPFSGTSLTITNSDHIIVDNIDMSQDGTTGNQDCVYVCGSTDVTIRGSTIGPGRDGIDAESGHTNFLVEANVFTGLFGDSVDFSDGAYSGLVVQDNTFEANNRRPILMRTYNKTATPITDVIIRRNLSLGTSEEEAIRLIRTDGVRVENNVIMNSAQQGLYIDVGCTDITVVHNTFFRNTWDTIDTAYGEISANVTTADIIIKNNIISGRATNPSFETSAASLPGEDYNLIFEAATPAGFTYGANTFSGDPLFANMTLGSEDLHLTSGSPAIMAATNFGVTDDKDKGIRANPAGSVPDIGAYEFSCDDPTDTIFADLTDATGAVVGSIQCHLIGGELSCNYNTGVANQCGGN